MKALNKTYIYVLFDPKEGVARYVGQTDSPEKRLLAHQNKAKRSESPLSNWLRALRAKNQAPALMLLESVAREDADAREKFWIWHFETQGANLLNIRKK